MAKRRKSGLYRKGTLLNTIRAKYQTRKAEVQRKKKEEAAKQALIKREAERKQRITALKRARKKVDEPLIKRRTSNPLVKATPTYLFIKRYRSLANSPECRQAARQRAQSNTTVEVCKPNTPLELRYYPEGQFYSAPFSASLDLEYATSPAINNAYFWYSRIENTGCFVDERYDYSKENLSLTSIEVFNNTNPYIGSARYGFERNICDNNQLVAMLWDYPIELIPSSTWAFKESDYQGGNVYDDANWTPWDIVEGYNDWTYEEIDSESIIDLTYSVDVDKGLTFVYFAESSVGMKSFTYKMVPGSLETGALSEPVTHTKKNYMLVFDADNELVYSTTYVETLDLPTGWCNFISLNGAQIPWFITKWTPYFKWINKLYPEGKTGYNKVAADCALNGYVDPAIGARSVNWWAPWIVQTKESEGQTFTVLWIADQTDSSNIYPIDKNRPFRQGTTADLLDRYANAEDDGGTKYVLEFFDDVDYGYPNVFKAVEYTRYHGQTSQDSATQATWLLEQFDLIKNTTFNPDRVTYSFSIKSEYLWGSGFTEPYKSIIRQKHYDYWKLIDFTDFNDEADLYPDPTNIEAVFREVEPGYPEKPDGYDWGDADPAMTEDLLTFRDKGFDLPPGAFRGQILFPIAKCLSKIPVQTDFDLEVSVLEDIEKEYWVEILGNTITN